MSFRNVVAFNLDEYYPIAAAAPESYHHFMREQLFARVDILPENVHLPEGEASREEVAGACLRYEEAIREAGGIDLQLLGIGRTGHIGFNEPGSTRRSRTRIVALDYLTRRDNAAWFPSPEEVPVRALTVGIGTILDARRVVLLAFGEHKAEVIRRAFEGEPGSEIPASWLQEHASAVAVLDHAAARRLTRVREPWLTGPLADLGLAWDEAMTKRAVSWLAQKAEKAVLKLTDLDYNEGGLQELLALHGSAYDINLKVFRSLQKAITGWPAGRPHEAPSPGIRRVLVFAPHPGDDAISMGGTLIRLAEQGHEINVVYQTSGSHGVSERALVKCVRFAAAFAHSGGNEVSEHVNAAQVVPLKSAIRRIEAVQAAAVCGLSEGRLHFLNMPFYDADDGGRVPRRPLSERDVALVREMLVAVRPHQIYAAGDLNDPHGTHRLCLAALAQALKELADESWLASCTGWLYRGAWSEWDIHEIDMAVPLSPGELLHKRRAIFQHESQKDRAAFLGTEEREPAREFWQRAEDAARTAALLYDKLGFVEYEALETFSRLDLRNPPVT